jgi:hypothetical protein
MGGPIILILVAAILELLQPGYDRVEQTISALVLGPFGFFQTIAFFVFGFLLGVFAWRVYASLAHKSLILKIATALLISVALGFFTIGIFPTQDRGLPDTLTGIIHDNTAKTISILFCLACFLLAFSFKNDHHWGRMFIYTLVMAVVAMALIVLGPIRALDSPWTGLYERIFLLNGLVWIEVVSLRLLTTCRAHFQNCCRLSFARNRGT